MSEFLVAPRRSGGHGSDRGRPRDPAMDGAILVATIELLSEVGYARLTVAEVARRSGVSKPTIYRRWARKSQLVVEAMVTRVPTSLAPDTGSICGDLAGPLYVRLLITGDPIDPGYAHGAVNLVLARYGTTRR